MDAYQVTVSFSRKVQVKDYEPCEGTCSLSANLNPGDDVNTAAATLMTAARATVINGLKGGQAAEPAAAPAAAPKADAPVAAKPAETVTPKEPTAAEKKAAAKAAKEAAPKPDNIATGEERVDPTAVTDSDIPDATVKARKPANAAAASDIPDDAPAAPAAKPAETAAPAAAAKLPEGTMTPAELSNWLTSKVNKEITVSKAKEILTKFGYVRTSECKPEDVPAVKAALEAEMNAV